MQQTVLKQAEERELAKIILQSALRAAKAKKTIHDDRFFEDYYDSIKNAASGFFQMKSSSLAIKKSKMPL